MSEKAMSDQRLAELKVLGETRRTLLTGAALVEACIEIDRLREQARLDEEVMRTACGVCTCNELCTCSEPMIAILSTRLSARGLLARPDQEEP